MTAEGDGVPGVAGGLVAVVGGEGMAEVLGVAAGGEPVLGTAGDARLGVGLGVGLGCAGPAGLPAGTGPTGTPGHLQVVWTEGMQQAKQREKLE